MKTAVRRPITLLASVMLLASTTAGGIRRPGRNPCLADRRGHHQDAVRRPAAELQPPGDHRARGDLEPGRDPGSSKEPHLGVRLRAPPFLRPPSFHWPRRPMRPTAAAIPRISGDVPISSPPATITTGATRPRATSIAWTATRCSSPGSGPAAPGPTRPRRSDAAPASEWPISTTSRCEMQVEPSTRDEV